MSEKDTKLYIPQTIIVEGKYDKIKLSRFIGSLIIQTDGFRVFKDKEKRDLIRSLAKKNGIAIITDSDVAGFKIRSFIKSIAKDCSIYNIYIPQIRGKESRKASPSKENLLGVEGMSDQLLLELFERYGIIGCGRNDTPITKQMIYEDGLIGRDNSRQIRAVLLKKLGLPTYTSTNGLVDVINQMVSLEEYKELVMQINTNPR